MKRMTSLCLAATLAGGSSVSAQTAQPRETTPSRPHSVSSTARPNTTVTLVGCLNQQSSGPVTYFLNVVGGTGPTEGQMQASAAGGEQSAPRPVGTSGSDDAATAPPESSSRPMAVGTSGIAARGQRVQVVSDGFDLADQVGQRIEVTGKLVTQDPARTGSGQPAVSMLVNAENVRSVAPTCNSAGR
jgi:hypothetical protein